jgi:hypothetical protein
MRAAQRHESNVNSSELRSQRKDLQVSAWKVEEICSSAESRVGRVVCCCVLCGLSLLLELENGNCCGKTVEIELHLCVSYEYIPFRRPTGIMP